MHTDDTIAAIASPVGTGGIGIVRVSGPEAGRVLARMFRPLSPRFTRFKPWTLHRGCVLDGRGSVLDDALAVFMPGPRTFTGEDVAEFHCHGGMALLGLLLEGILASGTRLAQAGEFSRRAFLNGRMDLTQAEAVAELISAPGREGVLLSAAKLDGLLGRRVNALREKLEQARMRVCVAVDFPEEEAECLSRSSFLQAVEEIAHAVRELLAGYQRNRCWQEGALVVLAGRVNVGKSSLMNALLGRERALVTDWAGTTRDFLEERVLLDGLPVRLVDTAGLRESADEVERLGIAAGRRCVEEADLILFVLDGHEGRTQEDQALLEECAPDRVLLVWNKSDLARPDAGFPSGSDGQSRMVCVSARTGEGLDDLAAEVRRMVLRRSGSDGSLRADGVSPNLRQAGALSRALDELDVCARDIQSGLPYDICALRLDTAGAALAGITGLDGSDALLDRIFSTFCIGK
ncbi:MAG: tRNA uridine-5-carboxymethylaminomethyl(34) synthesis GTPase MnmE [Deltaproteobacteria bacterium]|jgi:tRNA modification GTPase|nr:tRNA uridine-5-carboxymethylaminomethyl(34) synthesis GTPase MnmE [Deltaproteobacteria bacterium]